VPRSNAFNHSLLQWYGENRPAGSGMGATSRGRSAERLEVAGFSCRNWHKPAPPRTGK